ncbi:hypothetical protein AWM70_14600 [Paenibacillus yonginensis]|uniref:DUF1861 family protein n=2 Tax=Paenibacillus yonginensis TaxID=1462996 RepID=A0A1B1N2M8_9BACL|nr:DUF1861 family protein [Paenibacillus yonginensis]ANS75673.1 hypothetical protein AWM70_14600 [Paenibacillus yonginensis]
MTRPKETLDCVKLLDEYQRKQARAEKAERLLFEGVEGKDVYNIAAPFEDQGEMVLPGRVEPRDSEYSQVMFFVERSGKWQPREGAPVFDLQDPFHTRIGGELIIGGVQIYPHPDQAGMLMWRTVFYSGNSVSELKEFFKGPDGMKDLRLVELADGSIGIFTRPQGEKGGRGKIGFARVRSLKDLTLEVINDAPLLEGQFSDEEWGGANEAHLLKDGRVGVLGHTACYDKAGDRHYYPMAFVLNPSDGSFTDMELIAIRDRFLPGPAKRPDLRDVVFSGGLVRNADGTAVLYAGISDADAQRIVIDDPFAKFE